MNAKRVEPNLYWEQRLRAKATLKGTGHRAFSEQYNQILYQAQAECLDQLLDDASVSVQGRRVLDIGSGVGFFVRHYLTRGAARVVGTDLTAAGTDHLRRTFPGIDTVQCDVTAPNLPFASTFDLVNCISVLYHVLEESRFTQALANLCHWVGPGGALLVSDIFRPAPAARHARFRSLERYESILAENGMTVAAMLPVYFFLNRTFLPIVGPWVVDTFELGGWLFELDQRLRRSGATAGASMYFLLATRA